MSKASSVIRSVCEGVTTGDAARAASLGFGGTANSSSRATHKLVPGMRSRASMPAHGCRCMETRCWGRNWRVCDSSQQQHPLQNEDGADMMRADEGRQTLPIAEASSADPNHFKNEPESAKHGRNQPQLQLAACLLALQKEAAGLWQRLRHNGTFGLPMFANVDFELPDALAAKFNLPILDAYILVELLSPLLLGAAALTALGTAIACSQELSLIASAAASRLLPPLSALLCSLQLVVLRLPHYFGISLPTAALLAPLLTIVRMGSDAEITALRAISVSPLRLVRIFSFVFFCIAAVHLTLVQFLIPISNSRATQLLQQIRSRQVASSSTVQEKLPTLRRALICPEFRQNGGLSRLFFARCCVEGEMMDAVLLDFEPSPSGASTPALGPSAQNESSTGQPSLAARPVRVVTAGAAKWDEDGGGLWVLREGREYRLGAGGSGEMLSMGGEGREEGRVEGDVGRRVEGRVEGGGRGEEAPREANDEEGRALRSRGGMRSPEQRGGSFMEARKDMRLSLSSEAATSSSQLPGLASRQSLSTSLQPASPSIRWKMNLESHFSRSASRRDEEWELQSIVRFGSKGLPGLSRAPLDLASADRGTNFDDMNTQEVLRLLRLVAGSRDEKQLRRLQLKLHQRFALPFAAVIFGVVGSHLGLRIADGNNAAKQQQLAVAAVPAVVFSYYSFSVVGSLVAQLGLLSPLLGAWLPNIIGMLAAAALSLGVI